MFKQAKPPNLKISDWAVFIKNKYRKIPSKNHLYKGNPQSGKGYKGKSEAEGVILYFLIFLLFPQFPLFKGNTAQRKGLPAHSSA
jgi:hypothetical protein